MTSWNFPFCSQCDRELYTTDKQCLQLMLLIYICFVNLKITLLNVKNPYSTSLLFIAEIILLLGGSMQTNKLFSQYRQTHSLPQNNDYKKRASRTEILTTPVYTFVKGKVWRWKQQRRQVVNDWREKLRLLELFLDFNSTFTIYLEKLRLLELFLDFIARSQFI